MKNVSPRQQHKDRVDPGEVLSKTPIEVPLDQQQSGRSIAQQIQDQIAMQLAKKDQGVNQQSAAEILAELQDLEPDDPDPPWTSQFEVQELIEAEYQVPEISEPPEGGPEAPESAPPEVESDPVPEASPVPP